MDDSIESLGRRVARIESHNKRLKLVGALALTIACSLLLMGQLKPEKLTIEAERIIVRDSEGRPRIVMSVERLATGLTTLFSMVDEKGKPQIVMSVSDNESSLFFVDENDRHRISFSLDAEQAHLGIGGGEGMPTALLVARETGAGLIFMGGENKIELSIGSDTKLGSALEILHRNGQAKLVMKGGTKTGPSNLRILGSDGKELFKAP